MRLLFDMNLTPRWIPYLEAKGHHPTHWSFHGEPTASDSLILGFCREAGWCLVTNDLDFPQILAHTKAAKPSIVLLRGEPLTPEGRGDSLCVALDECQADLEIGAILTLDWSDKPRARLLPLGKVSRIDS